MFFLGPWTWKCQCCIQMYFGTIWMVWGAQINASKKVLVTLFSYMFHIKTKWDIVYENLQTKICSRDTNILLQMHWTSNIFWPSATTIVSFWVSLNYPILNFKKMVCPKNLLMQHGLYMEKLLQFFSIMTIVQTEFKTLPLLFSLRSKNQLKVA